MARPSTIYLRRHDGALHAYAGRRCAKLVRECLAGRGGPEITSLTLAGYVGFLGPDGTDWSLEAISDYLTGEQP